MIKARELACPLSSLAVAVGQIGTQVYESVAAVRQRSGALHACHQAHSGTLARKAKTMHFYVDESGHTGLNLFDAEQPLLYYGCLSSHLSLDHEAVDRLEHMRAKVGASRLHANELGNGGLAVIAQDLADLQRSFGLRFGVYRVAKPDHAIICFFDQVFVSVQRRPT